MAFSEFELILGSVLVVVAFVSVVSSLLTMYIIHATGRWNGFLVLIYSMTVCQLIYDLTFFFLVDFTNHDIGEFIAFSTSFGGLSVTLWTNVLSAIVLYIVYKHSTVDIWKHYRAFFFICIFPPLIYSAVAAALGNGAVFSIIYNAVRFASIIFNLSAYLFVKKKLIDMGSRENAAMAPLRELASRLRLYPICQVVTRIPACYYQFRYGFGFNAFSSTSGVSEAVALTFYALFVPSAGIGYFLVFVTMQPQAKYQLKRLTHRLYESCCCCFHVCCEVKPLTTLNASSSKDMKPSSSSLASTDKPERTPSNISELVNMQPRNPMRSVDWQASDDPNKFVSQSSGLPFGLRLGETGIRESVSEDSAWECLEDMDEDELGRRIMSVDTDRTLSSNPSTRDMVNSARSSPDIPGPLPQINAAGGDRHSFLGPRTRSWGWGNGLAAADSSRGGGDDRNDDDGDGANKGLGPRSKSWGWGW